MCYFLLPFCGGVRMTLNSDRYSDQANLFEMQLVQMEALERTTGAGFWNLDLERHHLWWSPKTKEIHEVLADFEPELETAIDFYAPEYRVRIASLVRNAMETGEGWDAEMQINTAQGSLRWVHAIGEPVFSGDELIALAGSFRDISETKAQEAETKRLFQKSEAALVELRQMTNALNEAAIVTTADSRGLITTVNDKLVSISGYSRDELLGKDHAILKSGRHEAAFFDDLWRTISRGKVWRGEICNRTKDGELYWVDTLIYPVLDAQGQPHHYLSIRFDVTERVEATNLVTNFFDLSLAPHCILDRQGKIQQANEAFCDLVGEKKVALIGRLASSYIAQSDIQIAQKQWEACLENSESIPFEFAISTNTGELKHMEWRTRTLGSLIFVSGHDLTDEVRRRRALQAAKQAADEASRSKSAFLANMSHEVRTPLNAIIGVADAMMDDTELLKSHRDLLNLIIDAGKSLEHQLMDILDFSKLDAGKMSFLKEPFSPAEIVKNALNLHVASANEKGLEFDVDIRGADDQLVLGDGMRFRQILSNLASNAVKFTTRGGIKAKLECTTEKGSMVCKFTLSDTGIGFPTKTNTKEFDRFDQKGRGHSAEFGGTGLGLAISASIANQMGGGLHVFSEPKKGTTFTLDLVFPLPLADAVPDKSRSETRGELTGFRNCLEGRKVLVVDDNLTNQKVVSLLLKKTGCSFNYADNGRDAVEEFLQGKPDVILMDMMMPILDGLNATKEIRILEQKYDLKRTPIIMLTANAMCEHVDQAMLAGCDGHITKPVRGQVLIPKLINCF
jgi:PAS domain S-box-containing protein